MHAPRTCRDKRHARAAWKWTCKTRSKDIQTYISKMSSMDLQDKRFSMEIHHVQSTCCTDIQHGKAAVTCSIDLQLGQAARTWTLDMSLGLAAWTCSVDMKHGHAAQICSMGMHHGHTAWTCGLDKQRWPVAKDVQNGLAAWTCGRVISVDMQYLHWAWICSMDSSMDMQCRRAVFSTAMQPRHAARYAPWTCSKDSKFTEIKVSSWQDNNDDILLHQWRSSVPGPNQVGGEGLIADNCSLSGGKGRSWPWGGIHERFFLA